MTHRNSKPDQVLKTNNTYIPSIESEIKALIEIASAYLGSKSKASKAAGDQEQFEIKRAKNTGAEASAKASKIAISKISERGEQVREAAINTIGDARILEWSKGKAAAPTPSILNVSEFVVFGELSLALGRELLNANSAKVPLIIPLLNKGNLIIDSPDRDATALGLLHQIAAKALSATGAGQLAIHGIDPLIRGVGSPFSDLRKGDDGLLDPAITDTTLIEALFARISRDVQRVTDLFRGKASSLGDIRLGTKQPIEKYHLVLISDYPRGFTQKTNSELQMLMSSGPRCGVSFIVHRAPGGQRDGLGFDSTEIDKFGLVLNVNGSVKFGGGLGNGFRWHPEKDPSYDEFVAIALSVATAASKAAAPQISFRDLHAGIERWSESSSERIVARIGKAGQEFTEITLGDEREQKHNILISGAVGQGKSNLLMVLIHSFAHRYSPQELEMYLLDLKDGMTLAPLSRFGSALPHAKVLGLQSDREYATAVLKHLVSEFERRSTVMKQHGDNLEKFRKARPDAVMPRILLCIDEFQTLFEEDDSLTQESLSSLEKLVKKGRAYGIHVVLGTQTLSGITALATKQDSIFAQFPIRLALKNSPAESRVVLDAGNDEASRLKYRGEAVINLNFGQVDSNSRAVIAYAADIELIELRSSMHTFASGNPLVYDGAKVVRINEKFSELLNLRNSRGDQPRALLGSAITVNVEAVSIPMGPESGRHIAILGSGRQTSGESATVDLAIGVLQSAAISLAAQDLEMEGKYLILNSLSDDEQANSNFEYFLTALNKFGSMGEETKGEQSLAVLSDLANSIGNRSAGSPPVYVFGFAIDRLPGLQRSFDGDQSPIENLQKILLRGPAVNIHLLASWATVKSYNDHLGFEARGSIDVLLALRVQTDDVADLMSTRVSWHPRDNRGLVLDRANMVKPVTMVPFAPIDASILRDIDLKEWDS